MRLPEGKAIDAIIRRIEQRDGKKRSDGYRPEIDPKEVNRIDYVVKIGKICYALEHTKIEPFDDFHELNAKANKLIGPIIQLTKGKLPNSAHYELSIPLRELLSIRNKKKLTATQVRVAEWIISKAPQTKPLRNALYCMGSTPAFVPEIGIKASLAAYLHPLPQGELTVSHVLQGDREADRLSRLKKAYDDKLEKLLPWKTDGARTVLILEDSDPVLSNPSLIFAAIKALEATYTEKSDELFLISNVLKGEIHTWELRIDDIFANNFANSSDNFQGFLIEELISI